VEPGRRRASADGEGGGVRDPAVRNHRDEKCPVADVAIAEAVPFSRERPEVRDAEREECDDGRERNDRHKCDRAIFGFEGPTNAPRREVHHRDGQNSHWKEDDEKIGPPDPGLLRRVKIRSCHAMTGDDGVDRRLEALVAERPLNLGIVPDMGVPEPHHQVVGNLGVLAEVLAV
jgi:hypothetical protein